MMSKIPSSENSEPFRSNLLNATYYVVNQVAARNLFRRISDEKLREAIQERGFSYSEIGYLLGIRVNKSVDYGYLDNVRAALRENMPRQYGTLIRLSKNKYIASQVRRACEHLVKDRLFQRHGTGPWNTTYQVALVSPTAQIISGDLFSGPFTNIWSRRARSSVRNAKLGDSWSTGAITLFGVENWERLPAELRKKIIKGARELAGLIRNEYDKIDGYSPDRFYSLPPQGFELVMGRVLDAQLTKNREKKSIRAPLIVIDADQVMILPKKMIAEQKRIWELKKAKMGKID